MYHSVFHRGLRILLSVVLTATNGFAPGVVHRHAGGDKPHNHVANESGHWHPHRRHSHAGHHSHAANGQVAKHQHPHKRSEGIANSVAHSHFIFFGLPLTVPESGSGNTDIRLGEVALMADFVLAESPNRPHAQSTLPLVPQSVLSFATHILAASALPNYHPPHENQSLLCDTARLERSGVLQV
jgi:hypothetical protein